MNLRVAPKSLTENKTFRKMSRFRKILQFYRRLIAAKHSNHRFKAALLNVYRFLNLVLMYKALFLNG